MRRWAIAVVAVAAAAAALNFGGRSGETASAERASPAKPEAASRNELIAEPRRQLLGAARGDLFAAPPPPRAPVTTAPAVAPEPSVPQFPYRYGGWVNAGSGASHVFLKNGNALPGIKVSEMLDGAWRLDAVSGDRIQVSFVPGGEQLSMSLAGLMGDTSAQGVTSPDAVAAASRARANAPVRALPQPDAATQSAASTAPPVGGFVPAPASPVQQPGRRSVAAAAPGPATGATSSPMQPGPAPSGTMPSSPAPTGRLGVDAPGSGSMPTGPAQAATGKKLGL